MEEKTVADEFGSVSRSRQLASVIGKIISISSAMGPISHLMTRDMYALLSSQQHWYKSLALIAQQQNYKLS